MSINSEHEAFLGAVGEKFAIHKAAFETQNPLPIVDQFFAADAVWECHGLPRRQGRAELQMLFEEVIGTGPVDFQLLFSDVSGAVGWTFVDYPVTPTDTSIEPWVFRCMFTWRLTDGDWKVSACLAFPVGMDS